MWSSVVYSSANRSMRAWSWARVAGCSDWAARHFFMVCWNRSTLPQVLGWLGREFFWTTPRRLSSASKLLRPRVPCRLPPDRRVVNTMPLSVSVEAGIPWVAMALRNSASTIGPVTVLRLT